MYQVGHSCSVDNKFHKLFCRDLDEMINYTSHHMLGYNLNIKTCIHYIELNFKLLVHKKMCLYVLPICWRREPCICSCTCGSEPCINWLVNPSWNNSRKPTWLWFVLLYDMIHKERKQNKQCIWIFFTDWWASTRWSRRSDARREASMSLERVMTKGNYGV